MFNEKFAGLIAKGVITKAELDSIQSESATSCKYPEELLIDKGIHKHEILNCLSEYYGFPFVEYDENLTIPYSLTKRLEIEKLIKNLWFPLSAEKDKTEVIIYNPYNSSLIEDIKKTLGVDRINFLIALPPDLIRIIENNFDLNPGFPPSSGRTPLALVRTFLAERRSKLSCYRTSLAKGRTGLAFLRTGLSSVTIAVVLFRIFGLGYLTILEAAFLIAGIVMSYDGFIWYLPARKTGSNKVDCSSIEPTGGTTVLEMSNPGNNPCFKRTAVIRGAEELYSDWNDLSPIMRRRFLAGDRTDLAEERTTLASHRTMMARARTGLAFTRTGIAFIGIGIALLRLKQFQTGSWTLFDAALILMGILMSLEGFHWYVPGRRSGIECFESVKKAADKKNIWDFIFPPVHRRPDFQDIRSSVPPVKQSHSPGIWATTGLALERTVLAERRNVMARLRTVMARSRTGMSFIRTGMSISSVGMGLLVYFGTGNIYWAVFDITLILIGLLFIADGLYWHFPAEKIRKQFPYCFGEMEIMIPDYGKPVRLWKKVVFSHD
jgi:uncharacterized membrane protein YidH (DUF202 family)